LFQERDQRPGPAGWRDIYAPDVDAVQVRARLAWCFSVQSFPTMSIFDNVPPDFG